MPTKRRSPRLHPVKPHERENSQVKGYIRGSGAPPIRREKKIVKSTTAEKLDRIRRAIDHFEAEAKEMGYPYDINLVNLDSMSFRIEMIDNDPEIGRSRYEDKIMLKDGKIIVEWRQDHAVDGITSGTEEYDTPVEYIEAKWDPEQIL